MNKVYIVIHKNSENDSVDIVGGYSDKKTADKKCEEKKKEVIEEYYDGDKEEFENNGGYHEVWVETVDVK